MSDSSAHPIDPAEIVPAQDQSLAQLEAVHGQLLREADPEEFLPSPAGCWWLALLRRLA